MAERVHWPAARHLSAVDIGELLAGQIHRHERIEIDVAFLCDRRRFLGGQRGLRGAGARGVWQSQQGRPQRSERERNSTKNRAIAALARSEIIASPLSRMHASPLSPFIGYRRARFEII